MPPNNPFFNTPTPTGAPTTPQNTPPPIGVPPTAPATPVQPVMPTMPANTMTPAPAATVPAAAPMGSGKDEPVKQKPKNPNSTQNTLQLSEIRDNMVIMADGTFRAVVRCNSINFDLMSDSEREGIEFSYQNFLNSLNFPVQILIHSRRIDIGPYIEKLLDTRKAQDNMLLGVLMDDYINFVDILAQEANIMEKSFYITIPYYPQGDGATLLEQGKGFFGKLFAAPKNTVTKIDSASYQKALAEIKNRCDLVMSGLFQMGVQCAQLNTKELGELYYNFYNPDTAVRQPLGNFENATSIYVKKAAPPTATPGTGVPV